MIFSILPFCVLFYLVGATDPVCPLYENTTLIEKRLEIAPLKNNQEFAHYFCESKLKGNRGPEYWNAYTSLVISVVPYGVYVIRKRIRQFPLSLLFGLDWKAGRRNIHDFSKLFRIVGINKHVLRTTITKEQIQQIQYSIYVCVFSNQYPGPL